MVQVSYPGVYIQEVQSGVRTITSVATSIAAFFGRASQGPIDKAVRILSLADYERQFGQPHPKSDLAQSVRHFFDNGGSDCYVIRLAKASSPASVVLEDLNAESALLATARADGVWANTVRLEVDYDAPNPDESFNLLVIHEQGGRAVRTERFSGLTMDPDSPRYAPRFVTDSSELIELTLHPYLVALDRLTDIANSFAGFSQSRRPFADLGAVQAALTALINPPSPGVPQSRFEISVDGTAYVEVDIGPWPAADIAAADLDDIGTRFQDRINTALDSVSPTANAGVAFRSPTDGPPNLLTITSDGDPDQTNQASVRIRRARSGDIAVALMLGVDQGGIEPVRYSNFRPAPTASILRLGNPAGAGALDTLDLLSALPANAVSQISINSEPIALDLVTTGTDSNPFYRSATDYSAATGENDGVREKLRIIANAITTNPNIAYRAELWGYTLALVATGGTLNEQPDGIATATTVFNNDPTPADSEFILNTRQYTLGSGGSSPFSDGVGRDGDDGEAPEAADYLGSEAAQTGFHALDAVDIFNLMVLPGDEEVSEPTLQSLWGAASTYCKRQRAFLLVDPPSDWSDSDGRPAVVQDTAMINQLRATVEKEYAAVFYPRLKYRADLTSKIIGPAGAIAGLMARTDASRGVWKAPAGIDAGIRGILGLNLRLTDAENGVLNKKGVNCLRVFPNGIVSWGARTLAGDDDFGSEWKYIPVRRLALMIEESLFRGTKWVVFEPNDEPLWAQIRQNLGTYMMSLFRQGAFQGTDPKDAFYVKCDKETTTQDDINQGIVNIEVGFAPLKPAEFVIIKIQQIAGEL